MSADQLPDRPGAFAKVPNGQQTRELRAAGERERAQAREDAERARHAAAERRRIPVPGKPHGRRRPGDRDLRRFSFFGATAATARTSEGAAGLLAALETIVPAQRVTIRQLTGEALVKCRCDAEVLILAGQSTLCGCGRLFVNGGEHVRVLKTEPQPEGDDDGDD